MLKFQGPTSIAHAQLLHLHLAVSAPGANMCIHLGKTGFGSVKPWIMDWSAVGTRVHDPWFYELKPWPIEFTNTLPSKFRQKLVNFAYLTSHVLDLRPLANKEPLNLVMLQSPGYIVLSMWLKLHTTIGCTWHHMWLNFIDTLDERKLVGNSQ